MHDTVAITIQQAHTQGMLIYTHQIELMARAMDAEREHIAMFLEDHPEMAEFLSGDVQGGYTYVSDKPEASVELARVKVPVPNNPIGPVEVNANGS